MNRLTEHHRNACKAYDDICNGLGEIPYLPVAVFKDLDLFSVPEDRLRSKLTSSGTTGQKVSKIYLDGETAASQQRALCDIVSGYIGEKRIPMLIIDSPDVLRDRRKYSARGAGIMGFSMMASKRYYALDNEMNLDWDSINEFCAKATEGPTFAFGFTFMIWAYFYGNLKKENRRISLPGCTLIHGGGWKKLQSQSVSNDVFKAEITDRCGIETISNYYGMAEQTGSIFMECTHGNLHVSDYSDIVALNPDDFSTCETGEWGLLALESVLPKSYPGHRLMTEDWGRILGDDDCPCGRKGKYFEIKGRIKKAEIRGCSDTFAKSAESTGSSSDSDEITIFAGEYPINERTVNCFDEEIIEFLDELSAVLLKDFRHYPEIAALGFWCRRTHLDKIRNRQMSSGIGKGTVLHIAPSNMPTMFAYSWITSLLAGNSNIVRISGRDSDISMIILEGITKVLNRYENIRKSNAFIRFDHNDAIIEKISKNVSARIIWGGDETVKNISNIPSCDGCIDICFPNKYSIAVFDCNLMKILDDGELQHMAHHFYNDTYGADQNACSSPKIVFWLNADEGVKNRWWNALAHETGNYDLQPWMATEKYRMLCCSYAMHKGLKPVRKWGNRLYLIPCDTICRPLWKYEAAMGMFYENDISDIDMLAEMIDGKIQTVVTNTDVGSLDVDRIVSIGEALDFDTIWDRKDLIALLSE